MPETITTNMGLTVPAVGETQGPAYASEINQDLQILDVHDHSSGKGVLITPSGLNINSALPFGGNNATLLRTVRFQAQGSPITGSSTSDVGCVYVAGVDLYFNDSNGNQVRITSGGGVAGSPGSITNLTAPATATYVSASTKFVWQSDANIAADMDFRSAIFRNAAASSFGLTLSAPTLSGDTTQTLPATPGATCFLTMDSSGNMGASIATAQGITRPMQASVGQQTSGSTSFSSSNTSFLDVTGLSLSLTTTGRPVFVAMVPDETASNGAEVVLTGASGRIPASFNSISGCLIKLLRDATQVGVFRFRQLPQFSAGSGTSVTYSMSTEIGAQPFALDVPAAGTYTYKIQVASLLAGNTVQILNYKMVAYEL